MKSISIWASNNRVTTIFLLILFHFILWWIYFFIGAFIFAENIILPISLKYVGIVLIFAALIFYPIKHVDKGIFKNTFFRRKFWQVTAMMSVAVFTILFGNHRTKNIMATAPQIEFSAQTIALDIKKNSRTLKKQERKQKRNFRKNLRKQIRKMVRARRNGEYKYNLGLRIFLTTLTILVGLLLLYGIAVLSCGIACSGSEALAFLVVIGGLVAVVYGVVAVFKIIHKKKVTPTIGSELD